MIILVIGGFAMSAADKGLWTLANAKARLSELVERASREGPQTITRNGKATAVVVSFEEWSRKTSRKGTLAEFLLASPLRGADLDLDRVASKPRELDL
jgi:prevent-host-death family protein